MPFAGPSMQSHLSHFTCCMLAARVHVALHMLASAGAPSGIIFALMSNPSLGLWLGGDVEVGGSHVSDRHGNMLCAPRAVVRTCTCADILDLALGSLGPHAGLVPRLDAFANRCHADEAGLVGHRGFSEH